MGFNKSKSSSSVAKGQFDKNVKFYNTASEDLYNKAISNLQSSTNNSYSTLNTQAANALKSALSGNFGVNTNPYAQNLVNSLANQSQSQFNKDFAKAYSNVQGLGQGSAMQALGDVYSDYQNNLNTQKAQILMDQYNKDVGNVLDAASAGVQAVDSSQQQDVNNVATLLGLTMGAYGYEPVVLNNSSSWGFSLF